MAFLRLTANCETYLKATCIQVNNCDVYGVKMLIIYILFDFLFILFNNLLYFRDFQRHCGTLTFAVYKPEFSVPISTVNKHS